MIEKFEQLDEEKQEGIRRSALKIFADKGYQDASTNKIVKQAGISKGTLFYYFTNKEGLYHYLIDYSLKIIEQEYINHIDQTTADFILRMENNSKIKYQYFQEYPEVNLFLSTVLYTEFEQLTDGYQKKFEELIEYTTKKMNNGKDIKKDLFKEDINPLKATRIIELSIEGYFSKLAQTFNKQQLNQKELKKLWEDFDEYLDSLREIFYKNFKEDIE